MIILSAASCGNRDEQSPPDHQKTTING